MFKGVILGGRYVGKTSLMYAYGSGEPFENPIQNIGIDFKLKNFGNDGERIMIWDMPPG